MTIGPLARFVKRSAGWIRPYRFQATLIALGLLLEAAFTAAVPLAFQQLIDRAIVPRDTQLLTTLLTLLIIGVVIVAAAGLGRDYFYAHLCSKVLRDLRIDMLDHVHRLSPADGSDEDDASIAAHFSTDLAAIEHAIVSAAPWALLPALDVLLGTVLLFVLEWRLALIAALVFPLALLGPRLIAPRASRASYARKTRESHVLKDVHENLAARQVVRAFGLERWMRQRFAGRVDDLVAISTRTAFLGALVERSAAIGILFLQVVVLGIGALMAFEGQLTVGTLVSFQSLFMTVSWSLSYVTQYVPSLVLAAGGLQRIDELLATQPLVADLTPAETMRELEHEIRFEQVVYRVGQRPILNGLNLSIRAGERIAIVGPIGAGKSTVLRLMARFVDPDQGRIRVDGHDLRHLTLASLRRQVGVVFQNSLLIDDTIRENIRMGKLDATDSEIEAVASLVGLHRIVETLPGGYDTRVGTRGEQLSGGQRQLVAISRAVMHDPTILLLDEPTSALDAESDRLVRLAIALVSRGRTVIVVTHSLSMATEVDRVLVLSAGRLVEEGPHEDLLTGGTLYSRLWQQRAMTTH
ncbi:MAG TPA: ABC transporter ATP-binding protein [Vicinamibacterales bacterium]|nr:ABC transporter ATP-binding protein [Vicinamibacterales bacterium]